MPVLVKGCCTLRTRSVLLMSALPFIAVVGTRAVDMFAWFSVVHHWHSQTHNAHLCCMVTSVLCVLIVRLL